MSITLQELLEKHCGGVRGGWSNLQAVIPGGSSVPVLDENDCQEVHIVYCMLLPSHWQLGTVQINAFLSHQTRFSLTTHVSVVVVRGCMLVLWSKRVGFYPSAGWVVGHADMHCSRPALGPTRLGATNPP
jgi:hypothetical protein